MSSTPSSEILESPSPEGFHTRTAIHANTSVVDRGKTIRTQEPFCSTSEEQFGCAECIPDIVEGILRVAYVRV
jgi:hypothetical protein